MQPLMMLAMTLVMSVLTMRTLMTTRMLMLTLTTRMLTLTTRMLTLTTMLTLTLVMKTLTARTLTIALTVLGLSASAGAQPLDGEYGAPDAVRVNVEHGAPGAVRADVPRVRRVLEAAYRAAGLHRDVGRGFVRRARLAGLVPWVSVRTARNTAWRDLEPDIGRSQTLEVRATWRLDRLVFEPRELQVSSLEAARRRERRRLAKQVIRVYFAWRDAAEPAEAEAAAAELDALTDGWFSKAVENQGRTSENRTSRRGDREMP